MRLQIFYFIIFPLIFFISKSASAQTTWSSHIAPIVYNKCASCHHQGGAGHYDFLNYDTAKYFGAAINADVSQKTMPPFPPDLNYQRYAHERTLSPGEISAIQQWFTTGMALGDTNLLPPKPIYNGSAILSITPDYTFQMQNFTIPNIGPNQDIYWNMVLPLNNTNTMFIKGFEFLPGNAEFVHHALIYIDTGQAIVNKDLATPGPGFPSFGSAGTNTAKLIGAYVPGSVPFLFPDAFGYKIPPNAYIIFGMHYPYQSVGAQDSSKINLFLSNASNVREIFNIPALNHSTNLQNGPLFIPANSTKTFYEKYTSTLDISLFGVAPHMHLIGRNMTVFGVKPGNDTLPLISIPNWDFRWQGTYYFPKVLKLPAQTVLWASAFYDNTISNPFNPSNPPVNVSLGEATTDEMMLTYFTFTLYQNGDENIILDSTFVPTKTLDFHHKLNFSIYPNPVKNIMYLNLSEALDSNTELIIYDMNGKIFLKQEMKSALTRIDLSKLYPSYYLLKIKNEKGEAVHSFIKE